ncbi:unnamed protein product, partial [Sphacelaria rigidula]
MSVSHQAYNAAHQSSRRRRKGGGLGAPISTASITGKPAIRNGTSGSGSSSGGGGGGTGAVSGGRGHSRRTLWEDKDKSGGRVVSQSSSSVNTTATITAAVPKHKDDLGAGHADDGATKGAGARRAGGSGGAATG